MLKQIDPRCWNLWLFEGNHVSAMVHSEDFKVSI
jgi:hypothetical protein